MATARMLLLWWHFSRIFFWVPKLELWSAGNGELSRDMDEFSMLLPLLAVLFILDMDNEVAGIGSPPVVSQSAPLLWTPLPFCITYIGVPKKEGGFGPIEQLNQARCASRMAGEARLSLSMFSIAKWVEVWRGNPRNLYATCGTPSRKLRTSGWCVRAKTKTLREEDDNHHYY